MYARILIVITTFVLLAFQNCAGTNFSSAGGDHQDSPQAPPALSVSPAPAPSPGLSDQEQRCGQSPNSPCAVPKVTIDPISCAGINALASLEPNFTRDGSSWTCQSCTHYFDSSTSSVDSGPFVACVRQIYVPSGYPAEVQAMTPAKAFNWSVSFSCTPVDESLCTLTGGQHYYRASPFQILGRYLGYDFGGPLNPSALPAGVVLDTN